MRKMLIPLAAVAVLFTFGALSQAFSNEGPVLQDFDMNACYAQCGCHQGLFQACFDCKQQCERKYWKSFDKEAKDKSSDQKDED